MGAFLIAPLLGGITTAAILAFLTAPLLTVVTKFVTAQQLSNRIARAAVFCGSVSHITLGFYWLSFGTGSKNIGLFAVISFFISLPILGYAIRHSISNGLPMIFPLVIGMTYWLVFHAQPNSVTAPEIIGLLLSFSFAYVISIRAIAISPAIRHIVAMKQAAAVALVQIGSGATLLGALIGVVILVESVLQSQ